MRNTSSEVSLRIFCLSQVQAKLVKKLYFTSTTVPKFETPLYGFTLNILFHTGMPFKFYHLLIDAFEWCHLIQIKKSFC